MIGNHGVILGWLVPSLLLSSSPAVLAEPDWLHRRPGLEEFEGSGWRAVDWRDRKEHLEMLIDDFVRGARVPFELPKGTKIVPGEDDKELTRERTCASACTLVGYGDGKKPPPDTRLAHGALDIGSRITRDDGKTLEKLGSAPVRAIHPKGFVRSNVFLEQKIVFRRGWFRLIVLVKYGHVRPDRRIGGNWQRVPRHNIGTLAGRNRWKSLDPKLSKKMPDKGNHIHLMVEGIYDLDASALIAHNEQVKGNRISKDHDELLRNRAIFFNERLLPKVTGQAVSKTPRLAQ